MNKKDDNVLENKEVSDLEKKMNLVDFSAGHKDTVWNKILSKMQTQNNEDLSLDELDKVAGGTQKPQNNDKPKKGGS